MPRPNKRLPARRKFMTSCDNKQRALIDLQQLRYRVPRRLSGSVNVTTTANVERKYKLDV
jgi:hypothetical protein